MEKRNFLKSDQQCYLFSRKNYLDISRCLNKRWKMSRLFRRFFCALRDLSFKKNTPKP